MHRQGQLQCRGVRRNRSARLQRQRRLHRRHVRPGQGMSTCRAGMHGGHATRWRLRLYGNGRFVERSERPCMGPWWPACAARDFPPSAKSQHKTLIRDEEWFVGLCLRSPHEPSLSTTNSDSDPATTFRQTVTTPEGLSEQSAATNIRVGIAISRHNRDSCCPLVARATPANVSSERA